MAKGQIRSMDRICLSRRLETAIAGAVAMTTNTVCVLAWAAALTCVTREVSWGKGFRIDRAEGAAPDIA